MGKLFANLSTVEQTVSGCDQLVGVRQDIAFVRNKMDDSTYNTNSMKRGLLKLMRIPIGSNWVSLPNKVVEYIIRLPQADFELFLAQTDSDPLKLVQWMTEHSSKIC